jgi:hypothetical protein
MGFPSACTIRKNRVDKCPLKDEKQLKKEGRGSMDYYTSAEGVLIVKWYDSKEVTVASNHYSAEPTVEVKRWDKKKKEYITLPCPALIQAYNKGMGGLDLCDMLLSFYRIKTKSPKWYKRILFHFTDVAVVNAFILRKHATDNLKMPLYEFKLEVATSLMYAENFSQPLSRASITLRAPGAIEAANGDLVGGPMPSAATRLDGSNHWPEFAATRPRCCRLKGCKQRSTIWCAKCKVYLCIKSKQNCFTTFHLNP